MSGLSVRPAVGSDRAGWEALVAAAPDSEAAHAWGYLALLEERFGAALHRWVALRDGHVVGLLPLVFQKSLVGRFLTSVPYMNYAGVLSADAEARAVLATEAAALADRLRTQRLEIRGRLGADLPLPAWEGKSCYSLDLRGGREASWKRLGSKLRAQVRRPEKEGYTVRFGDGGATASFYRLFSRRWHELGSPALPRRFFADLAALFADHMSYVFVEKGGLAVASGVLFEWNGRVEIPWAASALEHNRYGVNMLLYWSAIERAIDRGGLEFDFGRSTPGTGSAKFKLQWGAVERPLVWNVLEKGRSRVSAERGTGSRDMFARAWKSLPRFIAGWLGPRLAARIPY